MKKFVSLVLVLTMVLAAVPSALAAETTTYRDKHIEITNVTWMEEEWSGFGPGRSTECVAPVTVTPLEPGTSYSYEVYKADPNGEAVIGDEVFFDEPLVLTEPGDYAINISWKWNEIDYAFTAFMLYVKAGDGTATTTPAQPEPEKTETTSDGYTTVDIGYETGLEFSDVISHRKMVGSMGSHVMKESVYTINPGATLRAADPKSDESLYKFTLDPAVVKNNIIDMDFMAALEESVELTGSSQITIDREYMGYWQVTADYGDEFLGVFFINVIDGNTDPYVEPTGTNPFGDVPADAYYMDAMKWATLWNITSGTSATTFSPKKTCTNAEILTFMWRADGAMDYKELADFMEEMGVEDTDGLFTNKFTNVTTDNFYYNAANWAYDRGMVQAPIFDANTPCTRAQAMIYLWSMCRDGEAVEPTGAFTDVPADAPYAEAVAWAVANDITGGTSATTFSPDKICTRAEIVTFLYRALEG